MSSHNNQKCPKLKDNGVGLTQKGFYFSAEGKTGRGIKTIEERNFIKELCLDCLYPECVYEYNTAVKKGVQG